MSDDDTGLAVARWCILRTSPGNTLRLAATLNQSGFPAWAPVEKVSQRVGRRRELVERTVSLTPSFVFADYERVPELVAMSRSPSLNHQVWDKDLRRMVTRGFPRFTVFKHEDRFPPIPDAKLDPLRLAEQGRLPKKGKKVGDTYRPGDEVKHPDLGFEGLTGIVEGSRGKFTLVLFPGFSIAVQIEPRHLLPVHVKARQS